MRRLNGKFEGWIIDEDKGEIFDAGGNAYTESEIRSIFFLRQWMYESGGYHGRIINLKERLQQKINDVKLPEVIIDWGDIQERYKHPRHR